MHTFMNSMPHAAPPPDARACAGAGEGVAAGLGTNADFADIPVEVSPSTVRNHYLRSCGRVLLTQTESYGLGEKRVKPPRVRWCGVNVRSGADGVSLYARPDRAYGVVTGVCNCGQTVVCPVCAPRVAAFRAGEVSEAFRRARGMGYVPYMCTYTIPHVLGNDLGQELDLIGSVWRAYGKSRGGRGHKDTLGYHRAIEITYGQNGWHPHFHVLYYFSPEHFSTEKMHAAWLAALSQFGRLTKGAQLHSFHAEPVRDSDGAEYIAKTAVVIEGIAKELTSGADCKGRSIIQLLNGYIKGDESLLPIWKHGVFAVTDRKVSAMRWSRGLRAELLMQDEISDEEIAQDKAEKSDVYLGSLNPWQWAGVIRHKLELCLLLAANQGEEKVNELLSNFNLGALGDEINGPAAGGEYNPYAADDVLKASVQFLTPMDLCEGISKKQLKE